VFDDATLCPRSTSAWQHGEQALHVVAMQAGRGFVQKEQRARFSAGQHLAPHRVHHRPE